MHIYSSSVTILPVLDYPMRGVHFPHQEYLEQPNAGVSLPQQRTAPKIQRFPDELYEKIVSQVDKEDKQTMESCSLVNSVFREVAQRILYRSIVTTAYSYTNRGPHTKPRWRTSARLCGYIEELLIYIAIEIITEIPDMQPLSRLKAMTLCYTEFTDYGVEWFEVPHQERRKVYELISAESVRFLRLERISGFPAKALAACKNLNSLVLIESVVSDQDEDGIGFKADPTQPQGNICSARVINTSTEPLLETLFYSPASLTSMASLMKLEFLINDDETYEDCQDLLDLTAPSLTELRLAVENSYIKELRLPNPHILRRIEFYPEDFADFFTVVPFLDSLPANNTLQEIFILDYDIFLSAKDMLTFEYWGQLEMALMRLHRLNGCVLYDTYATLPEDKAYASLEPLVPAEAA
ncbi:hypothetical protein H0H87_012968 [Tephrocybe sp. NHM501043]|nr:hypothetical protein H0H87_012968 [Tephrocybe sp. NHM501043]